MTDNIFKKEQEVSGRKLTLPRAWPFPIDPEAMETRKKARAAEEAARNAAITAPYPMNPIDPNAKYMETAVRKGNAQLVKVLLVREDVYRCYSELLYLSLDLKNVAITMLLLNKRGNTIDSGVSNNLLRRAAASGDKAMISALLDYGIDPYKTFVIERAVDRGDLEVLEFFINRGLKMKNGILYAACLKANAPDRTNDATFDFFVRRLGCDEVVKAIKKPPRRVCFGMGTLDTQEHAREFQAIQPLYHLMLIQKGYEKAEAELAKSGKRRVAEMPPMVVLGRRESI